MQPQATFWRGRQVCVTGGTGFLGFHLVQQLRTLGARVRVLALPPTREHPIHSLTDAEAVYGDVRDRAGVARAVANADVVFHTAGVVCFWGPGLTRVHSVHVDGTRNVLAAVKPPARVVHTSSIVAVGANAGPEPVTEDHPFQLQHLRVDYVQAKRQAEEIVCHAAERGQDVVVVNPSYLVGPEDHERTGLNRLCQRFWTGRIRFIPPCGINVVDVRDVATGHLLAAEHGTPGRRYLLGGEDLEFRSFFGMLAEVASLRPRAFVPLPWWLLRALSPLAELRAWCTGRERYPSRQHARLARYHWYCSSARAVTELGYESRPIRESLADLFDELQQADRAKLRGVNRWWMRPERRAA